MIYEKLCHVGITVSCFAISIIMVEVRNGTKMVLIFLASEHFAVMKSPEKGLIFYPDI